jgi:hypothetical protein
VIFALRGLPILIELGLLIFCLIDAIQTPESEVRNLPKWAWIVLILIIPLIGGIAWLVAGRPARSPGSRVPWPSGQTAGYPEYERPARQLAPDDDEAFLAQLRKVDDEHEQALKQWEDNLRRREQELRSGRSLPGEPGSSGSNGAKGSWTSTAC